MASVSVASVSLLTTALVTTMPAPREKVVEPFQWVFWPWMSTVRVVPCFAVFGRDSGDQRQARRDGEVRATDDRGQPLTSGVVAMTW